MYKIHESVRATYGQDGAVVLDGLRGRMIRLNSTGSFVLQHLEKGQTEDEIIDGVSSYFRISRETAETDVKEFLTSLQEEGLIHFQPSMVSQ